MKNIPQITCLFVFLLITLGYSAQSQEIIHGWQVFNTSNSSIPDNHICDVKVDKKDAVWVATWSGGLAKFDELRWTIYNPATCEIPSHSINRIDFDKNGRVWIATNGGGIASFNGTTWTSVDLPGDNIATCIAVSKKGDKLIGTPKHGLYLYDHTGNLTKLWGVAVQNLNKVYDVSFDKDGNALVSTAQGLLIFTKTVRGGFSTSFRIERREHTLRSMMDTKGRILAVDYETGHLFIKEGNRWKEEKNPNDNIMIALNNDGHDYAVSAMALYKSGRIVAGTRYFGGIVLQKQRDKFWSPILPPFAGYDLNGGITCLSEAEDQSIWVGTYHEGLMIPIAPEPDTAGTIQGPASSEAELEKARKMMQRRRVIVKDTVRFEGGEVDLMVWDAQKPDGDVITLIYNGKILLDKYEVTKDPARLRLTIEEGKPNKLVMYAHNTGEVPPNTAMLSIVHTDEEKEVELTSDLVNAEALVIIKDVMKVVKKRGKDTEETEEEEQ
ncbi:MAG: two-component regulator propeller domain-containing protein [Saprospiraceae bacterium]